MVTSRTIPSSTTLIAGTSGSGTVSSTAKASSRVSIAGPREVRLPTRARVRPGDDLHRREEVAEMFTVPSATAAMLHHAVGGTRERRALEHVIHDHVPAHPEAGVIDGDACAGNGRVHVIGFEELTGEAPEPIE